MITQEQADFFSEHGYLRIKKVYTAAEVEELRDHLDWLIENYAVLSLGWNGPWRKVYMDADTEAKSKLLAMHELQLYSDAWLRAVTKPKLVAALSKILGPDVEFHHSTLHIKPPETGQPFPMHQDQPFYQHADGRYVDVLVHLDDTCHENGEIRFLDGSHKMGPLEHVLQFPDGRPCTPHLPTDEWDLKDTVAVPAKAGDVVLFNINTIHGSHINQTNKMRRLVRVGYRHPQNAQVAGQNAGGVGMIVSGRRYRPEPPKPAKAKKAAAAKAKAPAKATTKAAAGRTNGAAKTSAGRSNGASKTAAKKPAAAKAAAKR